MGLLRKSIYEPYYKEHEKEFRKIVPKLQKETLKSMQEFIKENSDERN